MIKLILYVMLCPLAVALIYHSFGFWVWLLSLPLFVWLGFLATPRPKY